MTGIRKEDIVDAEIVDAVELASDGTTVFINDATVISTTSSTKTVIISGEDLVYDKEEHLEINDIVIITGSSGGAGDGTFTVASIVDSTTFTVNETIRDSTGGTADFIHPPGAAKVGITSSSLNFSTGTTVQNVIDDIDQGISSLAGHDTRLLTGGVAWSSGLIFNVSDLEYLINGVFYTSNEAQVTSDAADPTNDRIDVIVADTASTVSIVKGTASATPVKPEIGENEVEVTFYTVAAAQATPDIVSDDVYLENAGSSSGEWDATESTGGARIDLADTSDPYEGTKAIEATNPISGDYISFDSAITYSIDSASVVEFMIKPKTGWDAGEKIRLAFFNYSGRVSDWVVLQHGLFGFDSSNTTNYQNIAIATQWFSLDSTNVDELRIDVKNSIPGFFIDRIRIQGGFKLDIEVGKRMLIPTQKGQVLYSVNGTTYTTELPITSRWGWLVTNNGIHIVNG